MRRLICWLLGHRPIQADLFLPELLVSLTYCERCGQAAGIERH